MRFYAAWRLLVFPCLQKGVRKMMNTEQYREHIERTFNAFCKIVLYHAALGAYKKYGKSSSLKCPLTIFGSLILSLLLQQTSILWNTMRLLLLPFAEKRSLWKASSWQPRFCVCQKSGGKCCFCGTTSVTAIRKSGGCLEFAEVQSSTGGKEHCVCCEKKWRR